MSQAGAIASPWIVSRGFDLTLFFGGAALSLLVLALYLFGAPIVALCFPGRLRAVFGRGVLELCVLDGRLSGLRAVRRSPSRLVQLESDRPLPLVGAGDQPLRPRSEDLANPRRCGTEAAPPPGLTFPLTRRARARTICHHPPQPLGEPYARHRHRASRTEVHSNRGTIRPDAGFENAIKTTIDELSTSAQHVLPPQGSAIHRSRGPGRRVEQA